MKMKTILSVDDNEDDHHLLRRAWKNSGIVHTLHTVNDGEKAIEYLTGTAQCAQGNPIPVPYLILLDLKMPRRNGFEVLEWMNTEMPAERPDVAIFTSSVNVADIERAYELGARWYFAKPVSLGLLREWVQCLGKWIDDPNANDLALYIQYRPRSR